MRGKTGRGSFCLGFLTDGKETERKGDVLLDFFSMIDGKGKDTKGVVYPGLHALRERNLGGLWAV